MSITKLLAHAIEAHKMNLKLISFFSVPFLIAFPLSLLLPNFIALSGTFLRFRSIMSTLTLFDAVFITIVFLVALALFAFTVTAINVVIRSQRTLNRLTHKDAERIEACTFKLFLVFLLAFLVVLLVDTMIYQYYLFGAYGVLAGLLVAFLVSLAVLFAPQAIVIDDLSVARAVEMSLNIVRRRFGFFVFFLVVAGALVLFNTWFFMQLQGIWLYSRYIAIITNALLILPFLEVLKTQIYLSKYTIL